MSASAEGACQCLIGEGAPVPEFLHGHPLSPEELEMLRQQIERGFDNIAEVDDEIRHRPHVNSISPSTSNLRSMPLTVTTALVGNVVSLVLILRDRP